jgi:hypothetical protein
MVGFLIGRTPGDRALSPDASEQKQADQPEQDQRRKQAQNHFFVFGDGEWHGQFKGRI